MLQPSLLDITTYCRLIEFKKLSQMTKTCNNAAFPLKLTTKLVDSELSVALLNQTEEKMHIKALISGKSRQDEGLLSIKSTKNKSH